MNVRSSITAILLVGLASALLSAQDNAPARAVDSLKRVGFRFVFDDDEAPVGAIAPSQVTQGGAPTAQHFQLLAAVPTIRVLDCTDCKIDDETVKSVGRITNLERLVLVGTDISGSSFDSLTTLKSLRSLILDESPCTDSGLANVCKLIWLEDLSLAETRITARGLIFCEKLTKLRQLNLSSTRTMPDGMMSIAKLKELRSLNLSGTGNLSSYCAPLANLQSLEHLILRGTFIDHRAYPWIDRLGELRQLEVPSWSISATGLASLRSLKKLEELVVGGAIENKPEVYRAMFEFKDRLPKVSIARAVLQGKGNSVTISADGDGHIVSLLLWRKHVLPYISELVGRGELSHLRHITIGDQKTSDADLRPLLSVKSLRTVHLSDTTITREGIALLLENKVLEQIDVPAHLVTETEISDFSSSHPAVRIVRE